MTIKDLIDDGTSSSIQNNESSRHVEKSPGVDKACPKCACVGTQLSDSKWECENDDCYVSKFTMSWKENQTGFLGDVDMVDVSNSIDDIVRDIR